MAKSKTQKEKDHHADQLNSNKGTDGTNITNAKAHGNRSRQLEDAEKKEKVSFRKRKKDRKTAILFLVL